MIDLSNLLTPSGRFQNRSHLNPNSLVSQGVLDFGIFRSILGQNRFLAEARKEEKERILSEAALSGRLFMS